ncbi:FCD domain-containing protein [Sphingomonas sp. RHCKR7]|uniref:FadR/GntR family transcriptional regulator n=1 Tax=Sphingomonas folli TaxID=2862497 RepID=UPI001CA57490|nr:FCD domain-containing protein [Sphingomonas folli]
MRDTGADFISAPTRLYQSVGLALLQRIHRGIYSPDRRLPSERVLADQFKVSRPVMREALIALEVTGNLIARQGGGYDVARQERAVPGEWIEGRRIFEGEIVAIAAIEIDARQIKRLEAMTSEMEADKEDYYRVNVLDRQFHLEIAQATGNAAISRLVERLWRIRSVCAECCTAQIRGGARVTETRVHEHRAILGSLREGDPLAARRAMHSHFDGVALTIAEYGAVALGD